MYKFGTTKRFDKALKLCKKRGYPIEELRKAITILVENGSLPSEYKPHILHGNHEGEWEAHIKPNHGKRQGSICHDDRWEYRPFIVS